MNNPIISADMTKQVGWRYYNLISKKAMEQEFSLSGLIVSLSIAFLIVSISSFGLRIAHNSWMLTNMDPKMEDVKIYQLESAKYINNPESIAKLALVQIT